jgi:hypothetical protein
VIALSLLAKAVLAVFLLASIARAFAGRPAADARPAVSRRFLLLAAAAYVAGTAELVLGHPGLATALAVCGVEAACVSAWLARAARDEGDDDDGGGWDDEPAGPRPIDWPAFDRARRAWDRTGTPA